MTYKEYFNNKRIAVIGTGPHGEMITDIKFLLRNKADVTLFDMISEKRMKSYLTDLKELGLEKYYFGNINDSDLLNFDLILLSPEISKKSLFLKKAIQAELPIEFPDTLFFKLSPPITLIGVLGMYGKSAVSQMIYQILKKSFADYKDQGLFFIDPDSSNGSLTHLKKIKNGDIVLARIPDNLIQHYYDIHISPHVAVITSAIPFNILDFQTYNNFIVSTDEVVDMIKTVEGFTSKAKILRTRPNMIPSDWGIELKALHHRENMALVLQTSELFKVPQEIVKNMVLSDQGPKGSIEFVKKVGGAEYYNDSNSITPWSTVSAIRYLSSGRNIILILGGAYTGHDYSDLIKNVSQYVHTIILLPGSGTLGIRQNILELQDIKTIQVLSLDDAVVGASNIAIKGEIVLFSPGFEAVGVDISRRERGEKFIKSVRSL